MEAISISIKGFEQATAEVKQAVHAGVIGGVEAIGVLSKAQIVENIREPYGKLPPAVGFGILASSIDFSVTLEGTLTRLLVFAGAPADTYVDAIENGARPHMPPVSALLPWVKQKFGADDEKSALKIAWAIAKNMARVGMQGRYMFARAQQKIAPQAASIIERRIAWALQAARMRGADVSA